MSFFFYSIEIDSKTILYEVRFSFFFQIVCYSETKLVVITDFLDVCTARTPCQIKIFLQTVYCSQIGSDQPSFAFEESFDNLLY